MHGEGWCDHRERWNGSEPPGHGLFYPEFSTLEDPDKVRRRSHMHQHDRIVLNCLFEHTREVSGLGLQAIMTKVCLSLEVRGVVNL